MIVALKKERRKRKGCGGDAREPAWDEAARIEAIEGGWRCWISLREKDERLASSESSVSEMSGLDGEAARRRVSNREKALFAFLCFCYRQTSSLPFFSTPRRLGADEDEDGKRRAQCEMGWLSPLLSLGWKEWLALLTGAH